MFFPNLGADSSAKSHVNQSVELDDVRHEYAEVQEVDVRDKGKVMNRPANCTVFYGTVPYFDPCTLWYQKCTVF